MSKLLNTLPWTIIIMLCLTIGLAPFRPPHVWEKLNMLVSGTLSAPMDIFDLLMHGTPWVLLLLKGGVSLLGRKS